MIASYALNSELLKSIRIKKGLSYDDVSRQIYFKFGEKISPRAIIRWEQGLSDPRFSSIALICDYYMIDINDLIKKSTRHIEYNIIERT